MLVSLPVSARPA